MSLFDDMLKLEHYQELLNKLPDDEKAAIISSLKEFVDSFDNHIIKPLENYKPK